LPDASAPPAGTQRSCVSGRLPYEEKREVERKREGRKAKKEGEKERLRKPFRVGEQLLF
jgi:hypothetical protein